MKGAGSGETGCFVTHATGSVRLRIAGVGFKLHVFIRAHVWEAEWISPRAGWAELISVLSPAAPGGQPGLPTTCGHEFRYTATMITLRPIRSK